MATTPCAASPTASCTTASATTWPSASSDEWDLPGRDPEYPSDPVESFLPEIDRVLAQRREVRPPFATWVARRVLRKVWHLSGVAQRRARARVAA